LYFVPVRDDIFIQGKLNWHFGAEVIQHSAFSERPLLVSLSLAYTNPTVGWTFPSRLYHREDTGNIDLSFFHLFVILDSLAADFLEEHRRVLDQRLQPVIREITDSRARTRDELEGIIIELLI